ncbi:hypothetical protein BGS_0115 [Beggiatoa sp. SS]|nr:hypothetical protein BGS_0115 [Beggiatoa sp. SS]
MGPITRPIRWLGLVLLSVAGYLRGVDCYAASRWNDG